MDGRGRCMGVVTVAQSGGFILFEQGTYIQPDLAMIGGLTPCLEVARQAAARGITVAPHFLPGLFVHLNEAFPGKLFLEDFPLIESAFEGWPEINPNSQIGITDGAGHGLKLRD